LAKNKSLKVVAIGAGSGFGRGILADLMGYFELDGLDIKLVLVDINPEALERMYKFGLLLKDYFKSDLAIETTADRRAALPGADYVITSVAIKRMPLWEQDFRVPLAYGFKHVLGENGGPGAVFHALRNYQLMIPIACDVEALCPQALLLNFTNPESRIIMALSKLTKVKAVGLCHGVMASRGGISRILDRPLEELDVATGGLNHFFWVTKIADKKTGEDLYHKLRDRVLNDPDCPSAPSLVRKMVEVFGLYTYPSNDHIGEYLSFAYEFDGVKWHYGLETHKIPLEAQPAPTYRLDDYLTGGKPLDARAVRRSGELAVPIILGIEQNRGNWECAVNVPNDGLYVENLASDAVVEVPALMDKDGVHPCKVGALPEALAAFCARQVSIQKLLVEAYEKRSKNLLLQALLLDPIVDSVRNAQAMLDYMLDLQQDYLPDFS
jgi:alpha-galactosidase